VRPAKVDRSGLRISFEAGFDDGLFFAAERAFLPAIFFRLDGFKRAVILVFRAAFFFLALPLLRDFFAPPDFFFAMLESLSRMQTG
jgi:hypothetical protein